MFLNGLRVTESTSAIFTFEGLHSSMTVGVLFQARIVIKAFAAVVTLERPLFAVHQHVTLQSICTRERSRTFRAFEWFLSSVGAFV